MSRVLIDSLTHTYAKCENCHLYSTNDHFFQNKSLLFYKSKSIGQTPIFTCFYQVLCVFVGSEFSGSHPRLHTPSDTFANFHRWIHMSNQEYWFFHPMGYHPFFLYPTHIFFISFFFYETVRLILDVVPFYQPTIEHQTQCRSTMYSRHTIEHQTQCRSLPCTHTHVMRYPVHKCNAMPLHISHATCTMNATCNNSKSYFMPSIMDNHIQYI